MKYGLFFLKQRRKKEEEEKEEHLKALQTLYEIKEADNYFIAQQKEKMRQTEEQNKKVQTMQIQQMVRIVCILPSAFR